MKKSIFLFSAFFLFVTKLFAQEVPAETQTAPPATQAPPVATAPLRLVFPQQSGWNSVKEGKQLEFNLQSTGGSGSRVTYSINEGRVEGIEFDTLGRFSWTPDFEFVDRLSGSRSVQLMFEARNDKGERATQSVNIKVEHVNRPPVVGDLKPMYVRAGVQNSYNIEMSAIKDDDNDPVVLVPIPNSMPQGAKLTAQGEFTWKPSSTMFRDLQKKPITLEFYVEDQPAKARTKGSFRIEVTQEDMAPSIQMTPSQKRFKYKEDATINLMFQLSDENGENDIATFSFVSDNPKVPNKALVKHTNAQYEFIWKPGYDFVQDPKDSISFNITFFVTDQANKKDERTVTFTILNAVNEAEIDKKLYNEYRSAIVRAWDLMEQLKDTEKDLKRKYERARKGKKGRSLTNASLGAVTGIAPVVIETPATTKKISVVGGTMVTTIGTLEATEVIGRSTKDLIERLNYIMEKRNELQTKGDIFARKYALKSSRRNPKFHQDVDEFVAIMNLKGLVALELDAGWQNKTKPTHENVSKTFKDFSAE